MATLSSQAEPLLLVYEANNATNPDDKPSLLLNSANLDKVLSQVENRPLSIFTIVGPQKSGKTLLMGYIIKYLLAAEKDQPEWINWQDQTTGLEELQWPSSGSSPNNPGLWCYNRPFIIKDDSQTGNEVAVLLLYTQSSDKCQWTENRASAALAGLSICASSCTIFNIGKKIEEKCLFSLFSYTAHAMLGVNKNLGKPGKTPFKNALMLIRDWNFPTEFPYGISGGRNYVKLDKMKLHLQQCSDARLCRQVITAAFENISGFLLPFPGNSAVKPGFKGCLGEMDIQFVELLRDFISEAIDVDGLPLKRNEDGNPVSGLEWRKLVENYVSSVNSSDLEKMDPVKMLRELGVTRTVLPGEEKIALRLALQAYNKTWNRKWGKDTKKVYGEAELDEFHRTAKRRALKVLKLEMFPESDEAGEEPEDNPELQKMYKKAEQLLKAKLDDLFKENLAEAEKIKLAALEKYNVELIRQYNDSMLRAFPVGGKAPSEKLVRNESCANVETLKQRFQEKAGNVPGIFQAFCQELNKAEDKMLAKILRKDQVKGESAPHFIPKATLHSLPTQIETEKPVMAPYSGSLLPQEVVKPGFSKAGVQTRSSRESKRLEEERLKERATRLVENLKQEYCTNLQEQLKNEAVSLKSFHEKQMRTIFGTFDSDVPFPESSQEYKLYREILEGDLEMALSKAKSRQRQTLKSKQSQREELVKKAVFNYSERMDQYLIDNQHLSQDHLERTHQKFKNAELDNLQQNLSLLEYSKAEVRVEQETAEIFAKLKGKMEMGRNITANQSRQMVNDLKSEYGNKLGQALETVENEKELQKAHETAKRQILDKFCAQNGTRDDKAKFSELTRELQDSLNQQYSEFCTKFQAKLASKAGSQKMSTFQARQFYKEEMDKQFRNHDFIQDAELLKIHNRVAADAMKKVPENLDAKQRKELQKAIEAMLKVYQDENRMNFSADPAIGIDLGTTFSCVSVYQKGEVKIISNSEGKLTTPSYVLFQPSGEEIVGGSAKERAYENPEGTIFDAKRILGRRFDDPKLQADMKLWPFTVVDGGRGVPMIEVNGKKMNPEEISAKVLAQLKKDAETYLKHPVTKAVITVPAYFTDGQKQATIDAGTMSGLEVLSILTEPVAAAMAYRLQYATGEREGSGERHILIFDLGGGTFDVAILKTNQGKIEVLTVDGDTHLGGEDFDKNLMDYCAAEFKKKEKVDLFEGKDSPKKYVRDNVRRTLKRLQAECERQKIALASARSAIVNLDNIYQDKDLRVTVTRATFEKLNAKLFDTTIKVVEKSLKAAKLSKGQIDDIVLVGGSTRIPKIQQMLKEFFNGKELDKKINPDEAVAHGAGLVAAIKKGNVAKDNAAYTRIQDVTPMPIGVEVYGGGFSPIIPKSTKIPVKLMERYKTAHNNQTSVQITIYEGEETVAVKNKHLGDFYLNGIPPEDAGVENIDVKMVINEQGILHVTASVSSTGTKSAVTVTENKQRMGQAAIRRYIAEKANRG